MKYISLILLSLFLIAGCGKSALDAEKERVQKEMEELKKKIDSTGVKLEREKKSLDSMIKIDTSLSRKLNEMKIEEGTKNIHEEVQQNNQALEPPDPSVKKKTKK